MQGRAWLHIGVPVAAAVILNGVIFANGWGSRGGNEAARRLLPPGYIIGIIWMAIFAVLGYLHYLLYPSVASFAIAATLAYALAYPVLTSGLSPRDAPLYNTIALIVSFSAAIAVGAARPRYLAFILPLLVWASYVNVVDAVAVKRSSPV